MAAVAEGIATRPKPASDFPPVDLGGRCEIIVGSPLPDFDGPGGSAYVARSLRERKSDLFALVTTGRIPARIEALSTWRGMEHPNVLRVADWGVVDWSPENRRRFVIIFERPGGRRLLDSMDDVRDPLPDDFLIKGFLASMLSVLRDMNLRGITAGGIRPTNLFFKDAASNFVLLGDCVSVPAGYAQPAIVETIERGMAQPSGRGNGTIADDLYALGVTLLILALGRNPLGETDTETMLKLKMDKGTYPALSSGHRIPSALLEPLRGLMTDDPKQRWSLSDLDLWLQGRRLSPKQPQIPKRGTRPLEFGGEEHWHCRAVGRALTASSATAKPVIERGDLDKWLRRSLGDEQRADQVQAAIDSANIGGRGGASQEDRMVARVGIALDPPAPIRYRTVAVLPDGIGSALAEAMCGDGSPQAMAEVISAQLPMFWVNCQIDFKPEHVPLVQTFDLQRVLLEHTGPGFGIERVLYELNPACPCLSPLIRDRHVLTLQELLVALDEVGAKATRGREVLDRHTAAFIATNHKKLNDRLLTPLAGAGDPGRRITATLAILADVQHRFGPARLPNLTGWMAATMEPAFKRFKNRQMRERLMAEAEKVAREGALDKLLKLVDNPEAVRKDEQGFYKAMRQYEAMTKEIEKLRASIRVGPDGPDAKGRKWAALVSNVVAMAGLILTVVIMAGS